MHVEPCICNKHMHMYIYIYYIYIYKCTYVYVKTYDTCIYIYMCIWNCEHPPTRPKPARRVFKRGLSLSTTGGGEDSAVRPQEPSPLPPDMAASIKYPRAPSKQIIPILGPKVYKHDLNWAIWSPINWDLRDHR